MTMMQHSVIKHKTGNSKTLVWLIADMTMFNRLCVWLDSLVTPKRMPRIDIQFMSRVMIDLHCVILDLNYIVSV